MTALAIGYGWIALTVFVISWLIMVVHMCGVAADDDDPITLVIIPLFTMGIALVSAVWPASLIVGGIYALSRKNVSFFR